MMFTLITWLRQCLPGSSTNSNVTIFPFPNSILWHTASVKSTLRCGRGTKLCLLEKGQLAYDKWIFGGKMSLLPTFTYVFKHIFLSLWTHVCLFHVWIITQYYIIYFIAQIVPALTTGSSFWSVPVSFWYAPILLFFEHFLTFDSIAWKPVANLPLLAPGFFLHGLQLFLSFGL